MKSILFLIAATLMPAFSCACALAQEETSPMDIKFNRQAVRRLVFDQYSHSHRFRYEKPASNDSAIMAGATS